MNLNSYLGKVNSNRVRFQISLLIGFVILVTSGFEYCNWNDTYAGWFSNIFFTCLLIFFFISHPSGKKYNFRKEILWITFLPFLSVINSYTLLSQPIYDGFKGLMWASFTWVIYFLLHKYKVSESTILRVFLYTSFFIAAIQIVQQFTYPNAIFGINSKVNIISGGMNEIAEQRNGLWRFRMHYNSYFTAPILFATWLWLRNKFNTKIFLTVSLLLVSVYLTLTRQVLVSCILVIFLSFFMGQKKINFKILFLGLILICGLYLFYDVLFASMEEQTKEDSQDNIRLLSAAYFWDESIKNPLTFLFGYGVLSGNSSIVSSLSTFQLQNGFYRSDVGFIGQIYERGALYVIACYYLMYKVLFKLKNYIPLYVRMFVIFTGVMSIMIFPMITTASNIVWVMLLYVCDLHINSLKPHKK